MTNANLPLAADVRRQVRSKVQVRRTAPGRWGWIHDCGPQVDYAIGMATHPLALSAALAHLKECG